MMAHPSLATLIADELDRPVPDAVQALADCILAAHASAISAILFYGSCRRTEDMSGLIDLAVLHRGHVAYHGLGLSALVSAALPPHVVMVETTLGAQPVRGKLAIYAERQFRRRMRAGSLDTTVWARFCQPASLIHARDAAARQVVAAAIAEGIETAATWAQHFAASGGNCWTTLFRRTYGAELRPEPEDRADTIYLRHQTWFDAILPADAATLPCGRQTRWQWHAAWALRVAAGKTLNVARLAKAAFTFSGGADYVAWKIERHTGLRLHLTDWQRRHPVLAAPGVLLTLWRARASR